MPLPRDRLGRFFRELKRRNVYKVAITYLAVAFVGLQAVNLLVPATTLPAWADELLLALLIAGFPVALVVAWAFELTPDGVLPTAPPPEGEGTRHADGQGGLMLRVLLVSGLVAGAVGGGWYLVGAQDGDGSAAVTDRSVAVLPFETLGEEQASAFTDGVHSDILTRLSGVSDLTVTSRTSVMQYRRPAASMPVIAGELGVAWILRGEVQEAGGEVRVNARLVDARNDRQVWAEAYRRRLTAENLFAIQEEVTKQIVGELEARLTSVERRRLEARPTNVLNAYRRYAHARAQLARQTEAGMREAADGFRRAVERDSTYALAWAGLADALLYLQQYGHLPADSVVPEARRASRRALELDPTSAEAHVSSAMLHASAGDGPVVLRELERAVELRPSFAQAQSLLGWYYAVLGRPGDGLESARRAAELDPLAPQAWANVALGQLCLGRPDRALAPARRAQELEGDFAAAPFYEALALYHLGRHGEAAALLRGLDLAWSPSAPDAALALTRVATGDSAGSRELLSGLQDRTGPEALFHRGLVHAALGQPERAIDAFGRIEGWGRSPLLSWPAITLRYLYPEVLGPLRDHPDYVRLLTEVDRGWGLRSDASG
jgi:TolB-like protein/Tfp pilus assembly protein PilF